MIPTVDSRLDWTSGTWLNPPPEVTVDGDDLLVTAAEGSDLWRMTAYQFVHDDGHGLLRPFRAGTAVEVSFRLDYTGRFDQAGVLVRADAAHWVKAGVEISDGVPQLGAVVTHEVSDWSVGPVPSWSSGIVTIRVSRDGDALTVRARHGSADWRLVRLAPWDPRLEAEAGPYCCAPTRVGLRVRFTDWRVGAADERLHE
jgi:regulation of enolase protein 1 (concanavalin A-like superfamily)